MLKHSFRSSGKICTWFKEELISLGTLILCLLLSNSFQSHGDVKVGSTGPRQKGFLAMPVRESLKKGEHCKGCYGKHRKCE